MKIQRIVCITCLLAIVAISVRVFASNGVYVKNWNKVTSDYAVACNDVRLNVRTPPGFYSGIGYCRAQVGSENLTDGGVLWVRVQGSGDDRTYEVQEYKVKVYGADKAKYASAWGWIS